MWIWKVICCHFLESPKLQPSEFQMLDKGASQKGCSLKKMVAQLVKNPPAMWETWLWSLGWDVPPEKRKATYSSILAWRIPMDRGALWATVPGVAKSQDTTVTLTLIMVEFRKAWRKAEIKTKKKSFCNTGKKN